MAAPAPSTPSSVGSSQQTLSEYAGPYVTSMLGKAEALSEQPYQVYGGPMTAAESGLQSKVFQGLGNLAFPSQLGQTFSSTGAYSLPDLTQPASATAAPTGPTGIAAQYMNPYLQSVLQPQLEEMRRQSQINLQPGLAKLTQAGGFGGSRQAIMEAEANRNLLQEQNKTIGTGYANAYDKAMQQFNTEQGQAKTLADFMAQQGGVQRGIESEGVAADLAEFNQQRQYPYQQIQFQRDMISGLPMSSVTNTQAQQSLLGNLLTSAGGITQLMNMAGTKDLNGLLQKFGLGSSPTDATTTTPTP